MSQFIIEYRLKDTMSKKDWEQYITRGKVRECIELGIKPNTKITEIVNELRSFEDCQPLTHSGMRYYFK